MPRREVGPFGIEGAQSLQQDTRFGIKEGCLLEQDAIFGVKEGRLTEQDAPFGIKEGRLLEQDFSFGINDGCLLGAFSHSAVPSALAACSEHLCAWRYCARQRTSSAASLD